MATYCFKAPRKPKIALKSPTSEYSLEVFVQNATPHIPGPFLSPVCLMPFLTA